MIALQRFLVTGPVVGTEVVVVLMARRWPVVAASGMSDASVTLGASAASKRCTASLAGLVSILAGRRSPGVIAARSRAKRGVRGASPGECRGDGAAASALTIGPLLALIAMRMKAMMAAMTETVFLGFSLAFGGGGDETLPSLH
jgi:hypothetical protein